MPADFDDRWNEAMARYKAALADCAKIAEETTEAILGGVALDSTKVSNEERARTRLLDARQTVLILLRERKSQQNG